LVEEASDEGLHVAFGSVELPDDVVVRICFEEVVHFEVVGDEMLLELGGIIDSLEIEDAERRGYKLFQTL
jgi:hypothetical protein